MLMPETAMDEDNCTVFWKHDVRPTGEIRLVQPVPESSSEQNATNDKLWLCVTSTNSTHDLTAFLF